MSLSCVSCVSCVINIKCSPVGGTSNGGGECQQKIFALAGNSVGHLASRYGLDLALGFLHIPSLSRFWGFGVW